MEKFILLSILTTFLLSCQKQADLKVQQIPKSRVIVLTDMLNEADDSQTMVRLLMYSNEMDIEGIIAVSSCHLYAGKNDPIKARNDVHPEEIVKMIKAYGKVRGNLLKHASGWPDTTYLLDKVGSGPAGYGMSDVGAGKSTSGSKLIVNAVLKDDKRPLYFCINAGSNCLAQALYDLQESLSEKKFEEAIKKIRIYDDAGQDDAGAWIAHTFPEIRYQRSQSQVFSFMGGKGPVTWDSTMYAGMGQHDWASKQIQNNHGPLGELYPTRKKWKRDDIYHTLEGGGTSTWIGHVNHGLYVPEQMTWGGWGGRFKGTKDENVTAEGQLRSADLEETENPFKPFYMYKEAIDDWVDPITGKRDKRNGTAIYRWRRAYQNDFEARMDWCVNPFEEANHNPLAAVNDDASYGIIFIEAEADQQLQFDAGMSSDPDKDKLEYRWFIYPEAGTYSGDVLIEYAESPKTAVQIPVNAQGSQIHLILEVKDNNPVSLYDYRRVVIDVI